MPASNLFKKIEVLEDFDIIEETGKILTDNSEFISELLKRQLRLGKDGDGDNVKIFGKDFYSDRTIWEKEFHGVGFGKFTEWITNYMSGSFYAGIKVVANGKTFDLKSDVDYYEQIIQRSGTVIMQLNSENLRIVSEQIVLPNLQAVFKNRFNNGI